MKEALWKQKEDLKKELKEELKKEMMEDLEKEVLEKKTKNKLKENITEEKDLFQKDNGDS